MRWPMTVGYLFFAAVIWVFFGYKFAALRRRTPAGRPPLRPVLYSLALVGTAYVATAPEVAAWFDREVGRPNLAPMIGYCLATWWCCSAQAMLFYWRLPAERAWQRTRRRIPVYGLVVCAMVTLWFLGSAPVEHPADFETAYAGAPFITEYLMVFYIALVVSIVLAAFSCWRWSAEVVDPWLRRALLFTAAGLAGGAAYPLGKITVVGLRWANIGDPVTLANWNAIIIPSLVCGISTPLVLIGAIIPRLGPPVARRLKAARNGIVRLPVDTWAYWALTPLHSALCPIEPKLVHQPASLGERLTVRLRLFWRLAEIRDWEWKLRPYVHPHVIPIAERHCASGGVGVDDTWAIVEAAQVKAALAAIRQGARVERDADFPAEPDDVPVRTTLAVATERNRLVKVARAFHRSPIVGAVVAEVLAVAAGPA
ncbi:MAG TPA: MAB_1171c family putative transporter [Pseudonocardiaceae bacterium]|nr:MAB_1171c family putative transporter [Pseudonocardiaceae bacterium]